MRVLPLAGCRAKFNSSISLDLREVDIFSVRLSSLSFHHRESQVEFKFVIKTAVSSEYHLVANIMFHYVWTIWDKFLDFQPEKLA